jgi:hypothetical protein
MFDTNSWARFGNRTDTIFASITPLLETCSGHDVSETMIDINQTLGSELFYFAYGWCGMIPIDVQYIATRSFRFVLFHFYEAMFFILLIILLTVIAVIFRVRLCLFVCKRVNRITQRWPAFTKFFACLYCAFCCCRKGIRYDRLDHGEAEYALDEMSLRVELNNAGKECESGDSDDSHII